MVNRSLIFIILSALTMTTFEVKAQCGAQGIGLQVLGSGGPELDDGRASSGYVIWHEGRARFLVDLGSGSLLHFEQSGASINDLDAVLLSHLHVDHTNDLPALIKASFFTGRKQDLPLIGPSGNQRMPSTTTYVDKLFGPEGAYRYLTSYVDGNDSYRLRPQNVDVSNTKQQSMWKEGTAELTAVAVHHGPIPALAWKIEIEGKRIVFSGDMNNDNGTLAVLAKDADLLVAHNAVPEDIRGAGRQLHMPPSVIGEIASKANIKQLLLSHRMKRTLGREIQTLDQITKSYKGKTGFADDLQCIRL